MQDKINEVEVKTVPHSEKRLFHHLGVWPSICILSFFTQEEIIETLRRVNKEALVLCKRAYAPKRVALHRINLESVKFFERTEEIKVSKDSLVFFQTYKDAFLEEILHHYKNMKKITVNLNFLFEEDKKDKFFEQISKFTLKESISTFCCEDAMLNQKNLESLTKSALVSNLKQLRLPRNNLGNQGVKYIFECDRLRHIRKLDLSSNNISEDGVEAIANSPNFPNLMSLDLRINKLGNKGFKTLIMSSNYPSLTDLKLDMNKLEEKGAQAMTFICNLNNL